MSDWKCSFCGSTERLIPTGYVVSSGDKGEYEPETTFCCDAQKKNAAYIKKNFDADHQPDPDDVSKW